MTGTRSRGTAQRGYRGDHSSPPDRQGMPWWAAVLWAFGFAVIGAFVDIERISRLGIAFQAGFFLGCLFAVVVVQRKGLFGPMVQPPLIMAVAVPAVVLSVGHHSPGGGMVANVLAIGTPLIDGFPTMAITTGVTLGIGLLRLLIQRRSSP